MSITLHTVSPDVYLSRLPHMTEEGLWSRRSAPAYPLLFPQPAPTLFILSLNSSQPFLLLSFSRQLAFLWIPYIAVRLNYEALFSEVLALITLHSRYTRP